jgi:hypothetical protein
MPRAEYTIEAELEYNTWTDISGDWHTPVPLIVERGIEPGERLAGIGRLTLALYNPDGRYTPGHANATTGFGVGIGLRARANDGSTSYPLFYGRITAITPQRSAQKNDRHALYVMVTALDDVDALARLPVGAFPLILDAQAGDLAERLISRAFVPPGRFATWRLDHPQAGALGEGTTLSDASTGVDLDAGQSVFPWAGDTWPADLPCRAALRDVCLSEWGTFYIAADGTPTFGDRHARPKHVSADAELSTRLSAVTVEQEAVRIANRVELTVHPREVASSIEVLWQANHDIQVRPGQVRIINCPFSDPDQQAAHIAADDLIVPVPGVDFSATAGIDDVTGAVQVEMVEGGTSVRLALATTAENASLVAIHDLQVRGTPIRTYYPATIAIEDALSMVTLGRHLLQIDLPFQENSSEAEDLARVLIANRRETHPWLAVTVEATADGTLLTHALARDVGSRLLLTDLDLGLDEAACFVDHVRHEVARGGASHHVTWRTSPADLDSYWALGTSQAQLGQSTRLAY